MANNQCTISPLIYENCDYLKLLVRTKSTKKRYQILKQISSAQLLALSEICLNILMNRFKLTTRQKRRMLPYTDFIRQQGRIRSERSARNIIKKAKNLPIDLFPSLLTPIIKNINGK
jgi:hypothetical protein